MKYEILGKTYKTLKAVRVELEFIKYSVPEGENVSWIDTIRVFSIFEKFGLDQNEYKKILVRRRTRNGRLFIALNPRGDEEIFSVSREIKRAKFIIS